jgi:hypothetical protein
LITSKEFVADFGYWAQISRQLCIWDYWILYDKPSFPYINIEAIAADIRYYSKHKVNNIFVECEEPEDTSFSAFKQWLGYHLMVHPEASLAERTERFFNAYYGNAAPMMLEYLYYLQQRMDTADVPLAGTGSLNIPYLDRNFFEHSNVLLEAAEKAAEGDVTILTRIGYERVPVDAALLNIHTRFADALPAGTDVSLEQLFERYRKNMLAHAAYYYGDGVAYDSKPGDYAKICAVLKNKKQVYLSSDLQIPEAFKKRECFDINWSYGNQDLLTEVSDALFGYALRLPDGPNYHRLPLNFGIYDRFNNRNSIEKALSAEEIPQDEQFHLFSLGKHQITPGMICWIHWTQLVSLKLDYAYVPDGNNLYEVVVSMKISGEPYIRGSQSQPDIFIERVLLVR